MSEKKFKTGDIVRLKSGGPKMTVDGYNPYGACKCVWFPRYGGALASSVSDPDWAPPPSTVEVFDDALVLVEGD